MRKLWIKKPSNSKGYSFWETEVSDDEHCLDEFDFKTSICFVPEARYKELEAKNVELKNKLNNPLCTSFLYESRINELEKKLKIACEALEFYAAVNNPKDLGSWDMRKNFIFDIIQADDCDQAHYDISKYMFGGKRARKALSKIKSEVL